MCLGLLLAWFQVPAVLINIHLKDMWQDQEVTSSQWTCVSSSSSQAASRQPCEGNQQSLLNINACKWMLCLFEPRTPPSGGTQSVWLQLWRRRQKYQMPVVPRVAQTSSTGSLLGSADADFLLPTTCSENISALEPVRGAVASLLEEEPLHQWITAMISPVWLLPLKLGTTLVLFALDGWRRGDCNGVELLRFRMTCKHSSWVGLFQAVLAHHFFFHSQQIWNDSILWWRGNICEL